MFPRSWPAKGRTIPVSTRPSTGRRDPKRKDEVMIATPSILQTEAHAAAVIRLTIPRAR